MITPRQSVDNSLDIQGGRPPPGQGTQKSALTGYSEKENSFGQVLSQSRSKGEDGAPLGDKKARPATATSPATPGQDARNSSGKAVQDGNGAQVNGKLLPQHSGLSDGVTGEIPVFYHALTQPAGAVQEDFDSGGSVNPQVFTDIALQLSPEDKAIEPPGNAGYFPSAEQSVTTHQISELLEQFRQTMESSAKESDAKITVDAATGLPLQITSATSNEDPEVETQGSVAVLAGLAQEGSDLLTSQESAGIQVTAGGAGVEGSGGRIEANQPAKPVLAGSNQDGGIPVIKGAGQTIIADVEGPDSQVITGKVVTDPAVLDNRVIDKAVIDKTQPVQSQILPADIGEKALPASQFNIRSATMPDMEGSDRNGPSRQTPSDFQPLTDGLKVLLQKIQFAVNGSVPGPEADQMSANSSTEKPLASVTRLTAETPQLQGLSAGKAIPSVVTLQVPLSSPDWGEVAARRLVWMATNGVRAAQLQLNPRDLGPVDVQINLNKDQASIHFSSSHAMVREILEANLPRLREMFEGEGVNLLDVNVSDQSFAGRNGSDIEEDPSGTAQDDGLPEMNPSSQGAISAMNLVDFYA